jgi:predicted dehydrogenase/threonine dehydrogenase-like Zn-dependent dehydrogenase
MRQLLLSYKTGSVEIVDVPVPLPRPHHLVVRSSVTLVSSGTERMLVDFGRAGYLAKARQQPAKVRQVVDKIRADGLLTTLDAVQAKLTQPVPLGYCNVGTVTAVGEGVVGFVPGDRVVSNGPHAEYIHVAKNLCALVPSAVSDEDAAFAVLGSIALQGVRLISPSIGESFAVIGLGLVGLLSVQILRAAGCSVIAIDPQRDRVDRAESFGARGILLDDHTDPVAPTVAMTGGTGVDGVLIAAATDSSAPLRRAAAMARQRGRIVLTGVTGLELEREEFYRKELSFTVSSSYGPGRYDEDYESRGFDYPVGHVRWTAGRNIAAILDLLAARSLDVQSLVSHRLPFEDAGSAYDLISAPESRSLGILLRYPPASAPEPAVRAPSSQPPAPAGRPRTPVSAPRIGVIGAGAFAQRTLIPAFRDAGAILDTVVATTGTTAALAARRFGFRKAASAIDEILDDEDIRAVVIATRHESHADLVDACLRRGKDVFVEKPLAISTDQLDRVTRTVAELQAGAGVPVIAVGFNRRFAPDIETMRELRRTTDQPVSVLITVNAGHIPHDHWINDPSVGGGRIIGEACHFVDLARFLAGSGITGWHATAAPTADRRAPADTVIITLQFANGSHAAVHYLANGSKRYPKERIQLFGGGKVLELDNFRRLRGYGFGKPVGSRHWLRQDKGHARQLVRFIRAVSRGEPYPIPFDEVVEVTRVTLDVAASLR